jgi:tetratricopeptide (TPR) repeat protein
MLTLSSYRAYRRYFCLVLIVLLAGLRLAASTAWGQTPEAQVPPSQMQVDKQLALIHNAEREHRPDLEQGILWAHLALEYHSMADFLKAEDAYNHSLHLLKNAPYARPVYAATLDDLAVLYLIYGRIDEAESVRKQALAEREKLGDPSDIGLGEVHLADIAFARRQFRKAEQLAARGIKDMEASPTPPKVGMLSGLITVTYARCLRGHCDAGLVSAQQAAAFANTHFEAESTAVGFALETLGFAEWKSGAIEDGGKDMLHATQILRKTLVPGDPRLANVLLQYGDYLNAANKRVEAQEIKEEADRMRSRTGVFCAACTVSVYSLSNTLR